MPLQLGRNPKSYPPNDKYRKEWDRTFRKGKRATKATSGAALLARMSNWAIERYGDTNPEERKP